MINIFLKFFAAISLIVVLLLPCVAIYDWTNPWLPAKQELLTIEGQYFAVPAGLSMIGDVTLSRSYALIPTSLNAPMIMTVGQRTDGAVWVRSSQLFFWFTLAFVVYGIINIYKIIERFRQKPKSDYTITTG